MALTMNPIRCFNVGFNVNSFQRQNQPLNPQIGLNINSVQRHIQPLNTQIGFNVNSIQRQIQPVNLSLNGIDVESHLWV